MFASKDLSFAKTTSSAYQISRSLRFRSSASSGFIKQAGLPTPTSSSKWTCSIWLKRGLLSTANIGIMGHTISAGANFSIQFNANDTLNWAFSNTTQITTTQVFRDPSAWYHLVFVWDSANATAALRARIYVNGVEITSFSTDNRSSITTAMDAWNTTSTSYPAAIGALSNTASTIGYFFDGYFAECYNIDGQTLTPSSFGTNDATTGVWIPKAYTGTYGLAGFYFPFTDIAATSGSNAGFGHDYSGNGNYWNTQGFSTTAGTTYDSMIDTPTPYADGGNGRGNYAVLNPVQNSTDTAATITNGNLTIAGSGAAYPNCGATFSPENFKGYFEFTITGNDCRVGFITSTTNPLATDYTNTAGWSLRLDTGALFNGNTNVTASYLGAGSSGDVYGCAFDFTSGARNIWFHRNGTWGTKTGVGDPASGTYPGFTSSQLTASAYRLLTLMSSTATTNFNFGQRPFNYMPPSGYSALNTQNLPTPTIKKGNQYFDATPYTGNAGTQTITNGGGFQPDFVWLKSRSVARDHRLMDAVRGFNNVLQSDLTSAEFAGSAISGVTSSGFSLQNADAQNNSAETYAAWSWKGGNGTVSNTSGSITSTVSANTSAGFSVVTYTGNGTVGATVGHGLGVAPSMLIFKSRGSANGWDVYHSSLGNTKYLILNTTDAAGTSAWLNNTTPDSSKFTLNNYSDTNTNGVNYVAYCFANISGYSSAFSYTGNGSSDGPMVYLNFRPRWILWKRTDTTASWCIHDTSRDIYNTSTNTLRPNESGADGSVGEVIDILSNGFKVRSADAWQNASGGTYIGFAVAENPFKYSLAR
jgi:hypothetical protein